MGKKPAKLPAPAPPHRHWDKVVSAAYLRIIGHTQAETAEAVGRSERSIWEWENTPDLWEAARQEAAKRWLVEVTDAARRSVLKAAGRNAEMGLRILERVDPALAPKQVHQHTGENGGPVQVTVTHRVVDARD